MLIKMLETSKGSNDGIRVQDYLASQEYNVCKKLADAFVKHMGVAEYVDGIVPVQKAEKAAPMNTKAEVPNIKEVKEPKVLTESILKDDEPKEESKEKKVRRKY